MGKNATEWHCVLLSTSYIMGYMMLICLITSDVNHNLLVNMVPARFLSVNLPFFPLQLINHIDLKKIKLLHPSFICIKWTLETTISVITATIHWTNYSLTRFYTVPSSPCTNISDIYSTECYPDIIFLHMEVYSLSNHFSLQECICI